MTSRERVRTVINHNVPDYVPNGLGGCETTGLHIINYDNFQNILGIIPTPPRINTFMTNAVFEFETISAMEGDIILVASPKMCNVPLRGKDVLNKWKKEKLWERTFRIPITERLIKQTDGSIIWETIGNLKCPAGFYYFDNQNPTNLTDEYEYPDPDDYNPTDSFTDEFLRDLEATTKQIYSETDYSLCLGETITDLQFSPGGQVGVMVLIMEDPELMKAYLEKAVIAGLKQITLLEQAVGKYVDILSIAHDFGDNRGITIGDNLWREIYKPYYRRLFLGWHERTNMKINLHSCGSIETIMEDLIDCGLDIYNPVQISARNMEPERIKERFGKKIVFWGGDYDAQMMYKKSYEEVYDQVSNNLNILKEDGGHIFSGVHNLPADMPQEHLRAMLNAWKDNRNY